MKITIDENLSFYMLDRYFILLLISFTSMSTFSQPTLIGKWRRMTSNSQYLDTTHKKLKYGDIEIRFDSTFHIEGDSTTKNSAIPGWHTGDEYNGSWELRNNNQLTLWIEPKKSKLLLGFKIIKLTTDELVLRLSSNDENKYNITYLRL